MTGLDTFYRNMTVAMTKLKRRQDSADMVALQLFGSDAIVRPVPDGYEIIRTTFGPDGVEHEGIPPEDFYLSPL